MSGALQIVLARSWPIVTSRHTGASCCEVKFTDLLQGLLKERVARELLVHDLYVLVMQRQQLLYEVRVLVRLLQWWGRVVVVVIMTTIIV